MAGRPSEFDRELALLVERELELTDLVTLGQIRIEVILPCEPARRPHVAAERESGHHRHVDRCAVRDRERAREPETDGAGLGVRRRAVFGRAAAEELRPGAELSVDFEADDGFVGGGHAAGPYSAHRADRPIPIPEPGIRT